MGMRRIPRYLLRQAQVHQFRSRVDDMTHDFSVMKCECLFRCILPLKQHMVVKHIMVLCFKLMILYEISVMF